MKLCFFHIHAAAGIFWRRFFFFACFFPRAFPKNCGFQKINFPSPCKRGLSLVANITCTHERMTTLRVYVTGSSLVCGPAASQVQLMVGGMKSTDDLDNLSCRAWQEMFSGFAGRSNMQTSDAERMSSFQDASATAGRSFSQFSSLDSVSKRMQGITILNNLVKKKIQVHLNTLEV